MAKADRKTRKRTPTVAPLHTSNDTAAADAEDDITLKTFGDYATAISMLLFTILMGCLLLNNVVVAFTTGEVCLEGSCVYWSNSPLTAILGFLVNLFFLLVMVCGAYVCLKALFKRG